MRAGNVEIINDLGLHARAAAVFVSAATKFECDISLGVASSRPSNVVDGKSIMSVMLLAAAKGTQLELTCSGPDEDDAWHVLTELIANRFGEDS